MTGENNSDSEKGGSGSRLPELKKYYEALSNEHRITLLAVLEDGLEPGQITEETGISRQAVHNHINYLLDRDLIYKKGEGSYKTTVYGRYFHRQLRENREAVSEIDRVIEEYEEEIQNRVDEKTGDLEELDLSESEVQRLKDVEYWEAVEQVVEEETDFDF